MTLLEQIQNMSEEDKEQLLATDFGPELEKEAAAEVAKAGLADALYAYGAYMADREIESQEELSKEATEAFDAAGEEITMAIEAGLMESGILDTEDTVELHKEAQAAAAITFQGYSDQFEEMAKEAAAKKDAGFMGKVRKTLKGAGKKLTEAKESAGKHMATAGKYIKKHKPAAAGIAGAAALGMGALAYKKHHEKKASELTVEEMLEAQADSEDFNTVVFEGLDKLAAAGGMKAAGKSFMKNLKAIPKTVTKQTAAATKHVGKHSGKYGMGAGAALGAGTAHAAHKMADKD